MQFGLGAEPKKQKKGKHRSVGGQKILIIFLLLVIAGLLFTLFLLNKDELVSSFERASVMAEVRQLTAVPEGEPSVAIVDDPEILTSGSEFNELVYGETQTGDYVIRYPEEIVIYRREQGSIVYKGPAPTQIVARNREETANVVREYLIENEVVSEEFEELPSFSTVTDPASFLNENPEFYADVELEDLVLLYPESKIIVVFRPQSEEVVKVGSLSIDISPIS